jgi:FO synthase
VFLPLTQLCRDSCHYCTFAKAPRHLRSPYMSVEEAVAVAAARRAARLQGGFVHARRASRAALSRGAAWLDEHGFASTLHYVAHVAAAVRDRTGLLPHINAGCMSPEEMAMLGPCRHRWG